jgi:quinol monooxygenase YgiN
MSVTLINPFEIDPENDDRFLESWKKAADFMKRQPGFIKTNLHRSLSPDARFRFVNVAEWESPQHFMAAVQSPDFQALAQSAPPNFPALYEVVTSQDPLKGK